MLAFIKALFGSREIQARQEANTLTVDLPLSPTPDNAPALVAQKLVATVAKVDGVALDYFI